MSRLSLAVALAVLLLLPAAAPAKPKPKPAKPVLIGIADQKAEPFTDPLFRSLGIRHARRAVAWDALRHAWQVDELDRWMFATWVGGVQPLVTFARSRIDRRRHVLPSPAQFRSAVRAFRKRYPFVRHFVAWNESNHYGEPTGRRPEKAARLYRVLKAECRGCQVAAADLLEQRNMVPWVRRFVKAARHQPRYWGLHNYLGANRFSVKQTEELLAATKGEIWLTEVGGLVRRNNGSRTKLPQGVAHATRVTRFIFDRLVPLSPRITRVYLYHWNARATDTSWDSGLVDAKGRPRPALTVVKKALRKQPGKRPGKQPKR